jgi:hypothetical protein
LKIIPFAAPLLLCASLAAAQPADLSEQIHRVVEDQVGERLRDLELKANLAVVLLGINLFGIIPAYLFLLKRARTIAEEKVAAAVDGQIRTLMDLLDERDEELSLRSTTPVLVIADRRQTATALREAGFLQATTLEPEKAGAETIAADRLVVFDLDHGCSEAMATALIERNSLQSVLVYTSAGRSELRGPQLTFANSPVTLFSRLMELIRFRKATAKR